MVNQARRLTVQLGARERQRRRSVGSIGSDSGGSESGGGSGGGRRCWVNVHVAVGMLRGERVSATSQRMKQAIEPGAAKGRVCDPWAAPLESCPRGGGSNEWRRRVNHRPSPVVWS